MNELDLPLRKTCSNCKGLVTASRYELSKLSPEAFRIALEHHNCYFTCDLKIVCHKCGTKGCEELEQLQLED